MLARGRKVPDVEKKALKFISSVAVATCGLRSKAGLVSPITARGVLCTAVE